MLYSIIGLIVGALIVYLYLKPKIKVAEDTNEYLKKEKFNLEQDNQQLSNKKEVTKKVIEQLEQDLSQLQSKEAIFNQSVSTLANQERNLTIQKDNLVNYITQLQKQATEVNNHISELRRQAKESADSAYQDGMELASANIQMATQKMVDEYKSAEADASKEYLTVLENLQEEIFGQIKNSQDQLAKCQEDYEEKLVELADLKARVNAAVEQAKRQAEMEQSQDFYRLQLSQLDIEEIAKIRSIIPYLRNAEPVNKVIWKVYYEKPYTDLVGRVIGSGVHTGIYKITNIRNQMCYVGQSVDLSSRFKQHIKRGLGAEAPTKNKLYPAMQEFGPENFIFEILEECSKAQLDEREKFWGQFYKADEFGYSIKLG